MKRPPDILARSRMWWRIGWAAMLVLHAPITWGVAARCFGADAASGDWGSFFILSASNLFFVLEILFLPSLRVVTDRRAAVVLLLIVALLHVGLVDGGMPDVIFARDAHLWFYATTLGVVALARMLCTARGALLARLGPAEHPESPWRHSYYLSAFERLGVAPTPVSCWRSAPNRAPPVR